MISSEMLVQWNAAIGSIPDALLSCRPVQSNPILPFNSKWSRLPNPAVRDDLATTLRATGCKVRFVRDPGGMSATNSQESRAAVSLELVSKRSGPVHCDICTSLRIEAEIYESAKTLEPIGHLDGTQCRCKRSIGSGWQLR